MNELLTKVEASKALRVSTKTVSAWRKKGILNGVQLPNGHWRYFRKNIEELLNRIEGKKTKSE